LTASMMSELFPYSQPAFAPSPAWYDPGELSEVEPEQEPPRNTRRIGGNNPYGSRGCRSCITCRKRKGKCEYERVNDVCTFCKHHGHKCGPKVTKATYAQVIGGKPCPALRYSSIATEVEKEFPHEEPEFIHTLAGERLKEMKEDRERLENDSHSPPSSAASDATVPVASLRFSVKKRAQRSAHSALTSVKRPQIKKCFEYIAEHAPQRRCVS